MTVITKTFYYPIAQGSADNEVIKDKSLPDLFTGNSLDLSSVKLIETRILVRRESPGRARPRECHRGAAPGR